MEEFDAVILIVHLARSNQTLPRLINEDLDWTIRRLLIRE
jgi:hypothetical protein